MQTPWLNKADESFYPPLQKDLEVDVCVIGGGITGLTTAYLLQEQGRSVAVVERQKLAEGVSGHTSGHLTSLVDAYYHKLIDKTSKEKARQIFSATVEARELVERLISENAIDAGYERVPAFYYATDEEQLKMLKREREALQQIGVDVKEIDLSELPFRVIDAFAVEEQAVINAAKFVKGLAQAFVNKGGQVYEQTAVSDFDNDGRYVIVRAEGYEVRARDMVQATHTPLKINPIQLELQNYDSYVIAGESDLEVKKGLYYDFAQPYRYTRHYHENGKDMFVVGGFDTKTGTQQVQQESMNKLGAYASEHWKLNRVHYNWSTMLFAPSDDLPFIGEDPVHKNSYVATGFAGDGLTYGLVSAILNSSLITIYEPHPWKDLFKPSRFNLSSLSDLLEKGADTVRHLVLDRFNPDGSSVAEVAPGEGKILNVDGETLGVYVDKDKQFHIVDPKCQHMGCMVKWNDVAKTWDCGCHGSRYDVDGNVISGPATKGLKSDIKVRQVK